MNRSFFTGRLTKDPEVRYNEESMCIARFNLAVDRKYAKEGQQQADFFQIVVFGKLGEFVEKYLKKGTKIELIAKAQSGSYTKTDGTKVYYTEFVAQEIEFAESKGSNAGQQNAGQGTDDFVQMPDNVDELPFN